ncbi:MAG: spermidine synthase, partial [Chloroflexota bacterium]
FTLRAYISLSGEIAFDITGHPRTDPGFIVIALIVMLTSIIMAAAALPLGRLLTSMPPLKAYAIDITGSMTGIAAFAGLSGLATPPAVWFAVIASLAGVLALGAGVTRWSLMSGALLVATVGLSIVQQGPTTVWSSYYRIDHIREGELQGLSVNGIPHQGMWPVDHPALPPFYDQIYRWFPGRTFDNVLVVGAGSGTDVAVVLAHGAKHVDAVEIDATIQQVGIRQHPNRPYDDPRVIRHIDDGRSFLRQSHDKYDLVVFALPDSLTLVSTTASIRLESFLFTDEAFASVRDHLSENGAFVLYNYYREDWLIQKIGRMLQQTFGGAPLIRLYDNVSASLAAGPAVTALQGAAPPGGGVDTIDLATAPSSATDDWPFLYLFEPSLPSHYFVALGLILAWGVLMIGRAAQRSGTSLRRFSPHFFVLGIAFLLLETRSIVTFSLLFGSTWLVNALVFFAVLASVLLAILVASRFRIRRAWWLYAALLGSIAIAWVLPPASLLIEPPWLRYVAAGVLAFAPVFFANLVFSYSFRDTRTADMAFASNLFGAMVGGAIEYVALISGYQALLVVVAGLYITAYVLAERVRLLADVDLTLDQGASPAHEPSEAPATA